MFKGQNHVNSFIFKTSLNVKRISVAQTSFDAFKTFHQRSSISLSLISARLPKIPSWPPSAKRASLRTEKTWIDFYIFAVAEKSAERKLFVRSTETKPLKLIEWRRQWKGFCRVETSIFCKQQIRHVVDNNLESWRELLVNTLRFITQNFFPLNETSSLCANRIKVYANETCRCHVSEGR